MKIDIQTCPCPCVWSSWTEWSDCTRTCYLPAFSTGSRERTRTIEKQALNNGTACEGKPFQHEHCNGDVCCPVNCVWGQWNEWGLCPSGCDQKKTRTRVKKILAHCNGIDCKGQDYEVLSCSRERELEDKVTELQQKLKTCSSETTTTNMTSIVGRCLEKKGQGEGQMNMPNLTPGTKVDYTFKTFKADGSEGNQSAGIKIADYQSSNFWEGDESVLLKKGSTSGSMTVSEICDGAYAHIVSYSGTWSLKLCAHSENI